MQEVKFEAFEGTIAPLPNHRVRDAVSFEIIEIHFAGPLFFKTDEKA